MKVAPQALRDIRAATAWWKANRPAAPNLLREELRRAFRVLVQRPHIGVKSSNPQSEDIRRLFLRGTRYFI
jgi:plasmid stabilization system protein ParE